MFINFVLYKCRLSFELLCSPHRLQNRLCFHTFGAEKGFIPIFKKSSYLSGCQAFVVLTWLNSTSNSRAYKRLQSTVCKFFFSWLVRDFSFHTPFTTRCSDSTKSPRRLRTVNGKEKLPFGLGYFFPLPLALQFALLCACRCWQCW